MLKEKHLLLGIEIIWVSAYWFIEINNHNFAVED